MDDDGRKHRRRRAKLAARVFAEEDVCWLCGAPVDKSLRGVRVYDPRTGRHPLHPGSPVLDEVVPVSRGGDALDRDNIHLAHWFCNDYRGARMDIDAVRAELRGERPKRAKSKPSDKRQEVKRTRPRASQEW